MKWTKEQPKKEGYYWVKYDGEAMVKFSDDPGEPDVVHVSFDPEDGGIEAWPVQWDTDVRVSNIILWSDEPIPFPGD